MYIQFYFRSQITLTSCGLTLTSLRLGLVHRPYEAPPFFWILYFIVNCTNFGRSRKTVYLHYHKRMVRFYASDARTGWHKKKTLRYARTGSFETLAPTLRRLPFRITSSTTLFRSVACCIYLNFTESTVDVPLLPRLCDYRIGGPLITCFPTPLDELSVSAPSHSQGITT